MKMKAIEMLRRTRSMLCIFTALVFVLGATHSASAQWTTGDVKAIWSGYNNAFYYTDSNGGYYRNLQGGTTPSFFWILAEEIEVAEDAEYWDSINNTGNVAADKAQIVELCKGFTYLHGHDWSSDAYNDDLSVAVIAFIRCYAITGTSSCLSDAETNHNTVYSRGYDTTLGGGLWWNGDMPSKQGNSCSTKGDCIKGSSANWTFAIAGWLIDHYNGHTGSYLTHANTIYSWSTSHLYNSSTGLVYNDEDYLGNMNSGLVSYNFGLAIGAASYQNLTYGGQGTIITNMANYLMANVKGATVNGYGILPDYGQSNNGFGAFNGMTFRWTGIANVYGYMPSGFVAWAQQNLDLGWADRNAIAMSWDDWIPDPPATHQPNTPSTGLYSIDCTALPAGMFWVPVP